MNRVQVDVTSFESLYQEYKLTKEELETEKEEILGELRGSTGYFASARADRHRADIEAFYETGTGKEALTQAEGMIKATKTATESFSYSKSLYDRRCHACEKSFGPGGRFPGTVWKKRFFR